MFPKMLPEATITPFPRERDLYVEMLTMASKMHHIHGALSFDITTARAKLKEHGRRSSTSYSLNNYVVACVARAVADYPLVHAYRWGRRKLVLFDDVDVTCVLDREVRSVRLPVVHIVRGANRKSLHQVESEIAAAQAADFGSTAAQKEQLLFLDLPSFVRRPIWWAIRHVPYVRKRAIGTVSVSALGVLIPKSGLHGFPLSPMTLAVTIGSVDTQHTTENGKALKREYLNITLTFDHDIVDGAPAAEFARRLKKLVESGSLIPATLPADDALPPQPVASVP